MLFVIEGAVVGADGRRSRNCCWALLRASLAITRIVSLPADVYSISNVPLNVKLGETLLRRSWLSC